MKEWHHSSSLEPRQMVLHPVLDDLAQEGHAHKSRCGSEMVKEMGREVCDVCNREREIHLVLISCSEMHRSHVVGK